jgi:hypothetical protein
MRIARLLFLALFALLLCGCQPQPACPTGSVTYGEDPAQFPALSSPASAEPTATPSTVKIGGKNVQVDRVIRGPVCNDRWSGVLCVACDVQVPAWDHTGKPTFFKDCDLSIAPDTVIYVAAHKDAAYYNGCSCHTGGETK